MSSASALSLAPLACAALGSALLASGSPSLRKAGAALVAGYATTVVGSSTLAGTRSRSLGVGLFTVPALVATQAAYVVGFLGGVARGR